MVVNYMKALCWIRNGNSARKRISIKYSELTLKNWINVQLDSQLSLHVKGIQAYHENDAFFT